MKRAGFETIPTEMHDDPDWFEEALGGGGCQGGANGVTVGHCHHLKKHNFVQKTFLATLKLDFLLIARSSFEISNKCLIKNFTLHSKHPFI